MNGMNNEITLETLAVSLEGIRADMATKTGLMGLKSEVNAMRDEMATKTELANLRSEVDAMRDEMATKTDLEEGLDGLARIVNKGFDRLESQMVKREEFAKLAAQVKVAESKLGIVVA